MTEKNGGPEFPGMTLRDYFAGQALAGMCSIGMGAWSSSSDPEVNRAAMADIAFKTADAMLSERDK